jgi:16S rRNA (cytidine1402-2'-O)-methyltransferase
VTRDPRLATLYVVATPLGNLGDLSARAAEVLRTVPVVAAEDTRRTRQLLSHLDAHPRLVSVPAHAERERVEQLAALLEGGTDVALVSDAGTPVISDPGAALVQAVRSRGVQVVPVPGPSAVIAALSASGFPADRFLFLGFLPRKGSDRERLLAQVAQSEFTVVLFEAPRRLGSLLNDLARETGAGRAAAVARELTKRHEEIRLGTLDELSRYYAEAEPRGECTVVVRGTERKTAPAPDGSAARALASRLLSHGLSRREAVRQLAAETGLSRNDAYRLVMELSSC